MDLWQVLHALLFAILGFTIYAGGQRILSHPSFRRQFLGENEKLVLKLQELVRAQNEVLLLELEVAELVENVQPIEQARWIARMREMAHALPPVVLQQARRFGLASPPPLADEVLTPSVAPAPTVTASEHEFAQVLPISGWTGRHPGQ